VLYPETQDINDQGISFDWYRWSHSEALNLSYSRRFEDTWERLESLFCQQWQYHCLDGPRDPIELKKVAYIFWTTRIHNYCITCQPLLLPDRLESDARCLYSVFEHFAGRWRCIPCVLKEET